MPAHAREPSFAALFTPKLVSTLREGYSLAALRADAIAGLTVAIVALPLSMAIAIASGVTPDRGLYTAVIGGFLVSALGGSRFQIGGPAGAFIVLVAATVAAHGIDGLILATLLSGLLLVAAGFLRLGTFIKYIPYPVTVGFTAGIAIIIFVSQLKDLFGLTLQGPEPGELLAKLETLFTALPTLSAPAAGLGALTIIIIALTRRYRPRWPGLLIAIVLASLIATALHLDVETIGTRFGGIPSMLPAPRLPVFSLRKIIEILPAALSFALLGSIESLLSAVVADSMSGRRHRSNCELVGQGFANIGSSLFGGFCVTGTIARTATNVRSGAHGPVAGMLHALFILLFMIFAAPLAAYIPLAGLAGLLITVAWTMAEKHAVATLIRASRGDAIVVLVTLALTLFRDLTAGILGGFSVAAMLFLHRMAQAVDVDRSMPSVPEDVADGDDAPHLSSDPDIVVYRISGAFFFGAAASVGAALDQLAANPKAYVIDFAAVPVLDSTAAATIEAFVRKAEQHNVKICLTGGRAAVMDILLAHGLHPPRVALNDDIPAGIAAMRGAIAHPSNIRI